MSDEAEWIRCDACGDEWPPEAFRASGSAYHGKTGRRVCGACFDDFYPRRVVRCSVCGGRLSTRGYALHPAHRACQRAA